MTDRRPEFDPLSDLALSASHRAAVREQLDQLAAQSEDADLRDLARDVLVGRTSLPGALLGPRLSGVLDVQVGRFSEWYRNLSPDERAEHVRRAEEFADEARRERVGDQQRRRPRPSDEDDWDEPRPVLRRRHR